MRTLEMPLVATPAAAGKDTSQKHFLHVVGARPNFMKAAPVIRALGEKGSRQTLVHTGQHYDFNMSEVFFEQLGLPRQEINLEVGSGSHSKQTAEIMMRLEPVLLERKPAAVVVYGDVNSTVAAALVSAKLGIPLVHVEAGLRSFDRSMPEEINRVLTDQIANILFTPSAEADENLLREGVARERIFRVGNVMIDSLARLLPESAQHLPPHLPEKFALVTLHRPGNVDVPAYLKQLLGTFEELSRKIPIIFPVHPRTRQRIGELHLDRMPNGTLHLLDPLPYLSFLALEQRATVVITDSGGIQEETTFLRVPCLTLRENTERPITVTLGSNKLVGREIGRLVEELELVLAGRPKRGEIPPLWDGHAAERIAAILA
ncbi:MAG TPA: UDP-N-acetylglucosamine 2-epimerase (non-hydrolyzing) [Candidatus Limnocylindria bacterium]|nr:UDP-N-acetylglucosamine 2-epimerase (non-hydrolyzing) [Candidatus Limnocylindria bacterium]